MTRSRPLLVGVGLLAAVLGVLAASQLLLPGLAAARLRDQLARDGHVRSVTVRAFPAVKLLWGQADSVVVHFTHVAATRAHTGDLLARASQTGSLLVSVDSLDEGPLLLREVTVRKHGDQIDAQAEVDDGALRSALPPGFSVAPLASGGGELLLRAQANVLGVNLAVNALLRARGGALVIEPVGVPLASLATVTVFSDPHLSVQSVSASARSGGFRVTALGQLVGA